MRVHIVDQNTVHRHLIARMVVGAVPNLTALTFAKLHDSHSDFVKDADLIITSGGTWLVHKNPQTHQSLIDELLQTGKPVLGICLGAESLANYFGAKIVELPERQRGIQEIDITDPQLQQFLQADKLPVFEFHQWAISYLPDSLTSLATSEHGVEIFKHREYPIWGTQFHPEVRRGKNQGHKVFDYILTQISEQASQS